MDAEDIDLVPDYSEMDRFVKVTDAARILGYASFQSVYQIIERNELTAYKIPNHNRIRILLSDLSKFVLSKDSEVDGYSLVRDEAYPFDLDSKFLPPKRSRGRPKKY